MKDSNDLNLLGLDFIENCKWETSNDSASHSSINDREQSRIRLYPRECHLDTLHEFQISILAVVSVPLAGLSEFGVRFRREAKNHFLLARL